MIVGNGFRVGRKGAPKTVCDIFLLESTPNLLCAVQCKLHTSHYSMLPLHV